jgi:hypothetical protein
MKAEQKFKYRVIGMTKLEDESPSIPLQRLISTLPISIDVFIAIMEEAGYKHVGYSFNSQQRTELQGQPKFEGLIGAMWDGDAIRYETAEAYEILSV